MVTIEDLTNKQNELIKRYDETIKPIFKKAIELQKELDAEFQSLLDIYYDENLQDKNQKPIRIKDIVLKDKDFYLVEDRYNQIIFGDILDNPCIICKKIKKDLSLGQKQFSFHRDECKDLLIVANAKHAIRNDLFTFLKK